jgi:hypothetical protein
LSLRIRGGGLADVVPSEKLLEISDTATKSKNASAINVVGLHLSCSSDKFDNASNFAGIIFYGEYEFNGHRIKPGYIVIKNTSTDVSCFAIKFN